MRQGSRRLILLTGGTGNMGQEAVRQILARSDRFALRLLVRPEEKNHPVVRARMRRRDAEIAWGDLTDAASVRAAVNGVDIVLHVGGLVSPLADNLPPALVTSVNVGGARNIVDAIRGQPDPDRIRLVYIGTVAQTGSRNAPIHWGRTGDPIKISTFDHYAVTKTQAEAIVAESGLRHWVSLRQSGMAHTGIWKIFDPIIFHNPINGVFEWSTAHDSGRLMAGVCEDGVPDAFWRNFYNIGGGAASRVVNHEFARTSSAAISGSDFRRSMAPHWSATRNFHGQWFADSDRLEEMVPFREQSLPDFFEALPRSVPLPIRLLARAFPGAGRKRMEALANGPGGTLRWFADDDQSHIRAFFGSRTAWDAIPREWDDFTFTQPSSEPVLLDHGYDDGKRKEDWTLADLHAAAQFRGGRCTASEMTDPFTPVTWECARGHGFAMTPNLFLRGGHWCPTCQVDPGCYDETARNNPFFAQVWTEEAAP